PVRRMNGPLGRSCAIAIAAEGAVGTSIAYLTTVPGRTAASMRSGKYRASNVGSADIATIAPSLLLHVCPFTTGVAVWTCTPAGGPDPPPSPRTTLRLAPSIGTPSGTLLT